MAEGGGISIQDMIRMGIINGGGGSSGGSGDSGGGSGAVFGMVLPVNICWWPIANTAPGGLFEIQFAVLAGCGNPRKFGSKLASAIQAIGDGFLKNVATGVQSSSFADLGHIKSGFSSMDSSDFSRSM